MVFLYRVTVLNEYEVSHTFQYINEPPTLNMIRRFFVLKLPFHKWNKNERFSNMVIDHNIPKSIANGDTSFSKLSYPDPNSPKGIFDELFTSARILKNDIILKLFWVYWKSKLLSIIPRKWLSFSFSCHELLSISSQYSKKLDNIGSLLWNMTKEISLDFIAWYGIYRPGLEGSLVIRKSRDINTGTMVNLWEEVLTSIENVGTYILCNGNSCTYYDEKHFKQKQPVSCNKKDAVLPMF